MATLFSLVALGGLVFGVVNVVRPRGRLGVVSRSRAWWWVGASLVLLVVSTSFAGPGDDEEAPVAGELPVATTSTSSTSPPAEPTTTSIVTSTTSEVEPDPPASTTSTMVTTTSTTTISPEPLPDVPPVFGPPADGPSGDPAGSMVAGAEMALVVAITDGDTVEVDWGGSRERLRLIGVNSPESGECWADEAGRVLEALMPVGSEVGMTVDRSDRDQFDRLLRYLWVGSMSVNEELVRRGAAISRRYPPDTALAGRLDGAQDEAEAAERGQWAPDACGPTAQAELVIDEVFWDAPGNDNENLNAEWVRISNAGDGLVEMNGWGIKDESASHRYQFPPGFVLAPAEAVTIYTGCGEDFDRDLYWCKTGSAIWNNDGDTAFLTDPNGNTHHLWSYSP
jgi:micrococcal nuclease